jgi:hypothetical protein
MPRLNNWSKSSQHKARSHYPAVMPGWHYCPRTNVTWHYPASPGITAGLPAYQLYQRFFQTIVVLRHCCSHFEIKFSKTTEIHLHICTYRNASRLYQNVSKRLRKNKRFKTPAQK